MAERFIMSTFDGALPAAAVYAEVQRLVRDGRTGSPGRDYRETGFGSVVCLHWPHLAQPFASTAEAVRWFEAHRHANVAHITRVIDPQSNNGQNSRELWLVGAFCDDWKNTP
jgi:hypothetical protein